MNLQEALKRIESESYVNALLRWYLEKLRLSVARRLASQMSIPITEAAEVLAHIEATQMVHRAGDGER